MDIETPWSDIETGFQKAIRDSEWLRGTLTRNQYAELVRIGHVVLDLNDFHPHIHDYYDSPEEALEHGEKVDY